MPKSCSKYAPAKMDKRVELQILTRTSDGQGGYTEVWNTSVTLWANIEPLSGYERFQASQLQTPLTHKIMMRYRSDITEANRLLFKDRVFDLKEVINLEEANNFLRIKAVEIK